MSQVLFRYRQGSISEDYELLHSKAYTEMFRTKTVCFSFEKIYKKIDVMKRQTFLLPDCLTDYVLIETFFMLLIKEKLAGVKRQLKQCIIFCIFFKTVEKRYFHFLTNF